MFKNHILIAFRKFRRNKILTGINIFGLAAGMATALVIALYVLHETSYDRFNEKADQIVRIVFKGTVQGGKMNEASVMAPVGQTVQKDFPEVLGATRLMNLGNIRFTTLGTAYAEAKMAQADSNFFQVFTLPMIFGNPQTALKNANSVVLSEAMAKKFFGSLNPVGKFLNFKDGGTPQLVTGVMRNIPENSHFQFDVFQSLSSNPDSYSPSWMGGNFFTYLLLKKGFDYRLLEKKFPPMVEKYMAPGILQSFHMNFAEFKTKGNDIGFALQPLKSIHLHADQPFDLSTPGDLKQLYIFGAIAGFMLLIACINFMNLSTAGASKRAREVGIRKVLGSLRQELIRQFLMESILVAFFALILSLLFVQLALPAFNHLAGQKLTLDLLGNQWLLPSLILFALFVGLLAGSYPALFLSSFKPVKVLKGRFQSSALSGNIRSSLVVFQFFISIALMVGTIVVYQQLSFIEHKDLGYNKEQVIILPETYMLGNNARVFRNEMTSDPRVTAMSVSNFLPAGPSSYNNFFVYADDRTSELVKTLRFEVDEEYIKVLGMKMISGRFFLRAMKTDSSAIIINETAARQFGWKKGSEAHTLTRPDDKEAKTFHVIGVVKDFNFKSLHEAITPLVMTLGDGTGRQLIKVKTNDIAGLLKDMKLRWNALTTQVPFQNLFLDERFSAAYDREQKTGIVLSLFAGLTIGVACLGLFGLAMFTAEQRTREIGIRKVLGASVAGITRLLSKDFLRLVVISNLIAWPLAWWFMHRWLMDFEYRISISWWIFAIAGVAAVTIALATVSVQAIRAGRANPIKSLRAE